MIPAYASKLAGSKATSGIIVIGSSIAGNRAEACEMVECLRRKFFCFRQLWKIGLENGANWRGV
jgi:hypothetical protein